MRQTSRFARRTPLLLPLLPLLLLLCLTDVTVGRPLNPLIGLECSVCKDFVRLARKLVEDGQSSVVPEVFRLVCMYKYKEARQVCDGVFTLWKPMSLYVSERILLSPEHVCGQLLGSGCSSARLPQLNSLWNVTFPPTPKPPPLPPRPPARGQPRLRVLHISDVHIDAFYAVGAVANCGLPTCCRNSDGQRGATSRNASYWGDYSCDLPWWTLDRIFGQLARDRQFDAIYFTGDLPDHHVWEQTRQQQVQLYRNFTELVRRHFPGLPFVAALGNHESVPVNSFPPPYVTGNNSMSWYYPALWQFLSHWVPPDQKENVLRGGFYTQLLKPGLRVVSLNVNYGNDLNWWILENVTDPSGQLQWLIRVLQDAEDKGEKVHILGHIPPVELVRGYSWNYYDIAHRYESTIAGHFFGHTHRDELGIFFDLDDTRRAFGTVYIMGSLKTDNNPSYRIYEVDGERENSTWQVLDLKTFVFNLTEANDKGEQVEPRWFLEYQATTAYGMNQTFPADWAELVERFEQSDSLFQLYYRFMNKLNGPSDPCIDQCKRALICRIRNQRASDASVPC